MNDTSMKPLSTFRIYYQAGDERFDIYTDACSAQEAVNQIRFFSPNAKIIDVAKIVKGWK